MISSKYVNIFLKNEEISDLNQITFTKAAINTGNIDFVLSRVVEPAFRFKPSPAIVTLLLKEILKSDDKGKVVYSSIDQALRLVLLFISKKKSFFSLLL